MWLMLFSMERRCASPCCQHWSQFGPGNGRRELFNGGMKQLILKQLLFLSTLSRRLYLEFSLGWCSVVHAPSCIVETINSLQRILKSLFVQSTSRMIAVLVASQRAFQALHLENSWNDTKSSWRIPQQLRWPRRSSCGFLRRSNFITSSTAKSCSQHCHRLGSTSSSSNVVCHLLSLQLHQNPDEAYMRKSSAACGPLSLDMRNCHPWIALHVDGSVGGISFCQISLVSERVQQSYLQTIASGCCCDNIPTWRPCFVSMMSCCNFNSHVILAPLV